MLKILKLHNLKFEYFNMSEYTKQNLPKYSTQPKLSKSPKSLNLDKLVKSYTRSKSQGPNWRRQGLNKKERTYP